MEYLENCLCCGGKDYELYVKAKDNYSTEYFDIVKCKECGFIFTNPRPNPHEISRYYTSPDYMSHNSHSRGLVQSIYRYARKYMMRKKLALIQDVAGTEKNFAMLDFGCGTGDFLGFVKQHGIYAEGVEPDAHAREVAKSVNNVDTYSLESSEDITPGKFDVITLWHVLEHVHELHAQIDYFYRWLKPGGKLLIALPNINSYDAKKYGMYWDALDVPRHLYHYAPKNLQQIIEKHHFRFEQQYPLFLDAYYVSMRSEWHCGTPKILSYMKAIAVGYKSNRQAGNTGNFSSLIYTFTRV
jgi:2-polyprenyl-3-methyl-5-hydroxy-6-metoxy-1,4-benzoquinol methylase